MLNLISDSWIPVRHRDGNRVIRPDQIADPDIVGFNWPRPDLNLACHELLIGMIYLASPPLDEQARHDAVPTQVQLREALKPFTEAFELLGEDARFLQDLEPLDGEIKPPDMLFIDSAGNKSVKENSDLMVKRNRYDSLSFSLAAMALYTLQSFAPAGGAGNRTSMRGGGPLVALVRPKDARLYDLIWANVPCGDSLQPEELTCLPWMRHTRTSVNGEIVVQDDPNDSPPPEMFFGQPRRLRLVANGDLITGVVQRPYGNNYGHWRHYLSPYYEDAKGQILPTHPNPGSFGYRNWRGVILQSERKIRPASLEQYLTFRKSDRVSLIVGGWAMDNMKPLDFLWSEQPVFPLNEEAQSAAIAMIDAAEQAAIALGYSVRDGVGESQTSIGTAASASRAFFESTEQFFVDLIARLSNNESFNSKEWLDAMYRVAVNKFDERVLPGLSELQETRRRKAVMARKSLQGTFLGYGSIAKKIYQALELELPPKPKRKKELNE